MLQITNSLSKTKQPFQPLQPKKVGMYVCGVTVYDYCHIGHARTYVAFDLVYRYLKHLGYQVTYVRNITDIDDKIINRAKELGISTTELTEKYIQAMQEDYQALNLLPPDLEPKATETIPEMLEIIGSLIENGQAYQAPSGDVYYDTSKFDGYGLLAQQDLETLQAGSRIQVSKEKKAPWDFILWKQSKEDEPGWDSAYGFGRPGWHLECSAMSRKYLGDTLDIHGGGNDLKFPHHENERAQSEACTGSHFVNTWMHTGFVQVDEEKMSKSLNNFFTIREVLKEFDAESVRYFLLASHYRSPINYSMDGLKQARASLVRYYTALRGLELGEQLIASEYTTRFETAMEDDFNTPVALSVLFEMVKEINRQKESDKNTATLIATELKFLASLLGIGASAPEAYLKDSLNLANEHEIEALILERNQARAEKNWSLADELRVRLEEMGVILEDGIKGTQWRFK